MIRIIKVAVFFLTALFVFASCKKEKSSQQSTNRPPVANAGTDQALTLPNDSTELSGSGTDPDGNIVSYSWSQISGPALFIIVNPNIAVIKIKNLIQGAYVFEIKVTDNSGLSANDSVIITVNPAWTFNKPPVAKAGVNQTITLPIATVTMNGSGSSAPNGSIVSYSWNQIIGPNQSVISTPSQVSSVINNLIAGIYELELKVTDNGGLSAKDTVQITVNPETISCAANRPVVNARLVPLRTLSKARIEMVTATAGTKILFAGGLEPGNFISTRVDIYDFVANTWSTAELSKVRGGITAASVGNKIFFAGGSTFDDGDFTRVDIYDAVANTWSTADLSEGRSLFTSATIGDKVFFAGGHYWNNGNNNSTRVDIYNNTTNTWSTAELSEGRSSLSATTAGNKIYFAGGEQHGNPEAMNRIDIYDAATNSWTVSSLNERKFGLASIAVANKIYWAGGINSRSSVDIVSDKVEIRDINTQVSTFACLAQRRSFFDAVLKGNEIVFFTGGYFDFGQLAIIDIYNTVTDTWSVGHLNIGVNATSIISVNNKIYVAGGMLSPGGNYSNQVWLLEW